MSRPEIRTIDFTAFPSGQEEYAAVRIIIGDDFKAGGGNDLYMARELPGALALSVGRASDPSQPNLFQWSAPGAPSTQAILRELLRLLERKEEVVSPKP